ncbi:hypothetical protein BO94DRAFT_569378 [Aspergillus sclerotioniger CBS 115572]|uniref:Uncharacterized protein n=1 Tax=Aspergillus sclerotioniger CBS 115572 TaxID=1450535 RepID=A0A317VAE3_9EURO|nr:hypothetical protein BO94DRAFT_569378 [Aspergillus sclerotioniger CBS 115572]PWY71065.1 hypothetical protein BO94DRAFT_569378 [Aspergillus sclerotioniger CBS 115572]
MFIIAPPPVTLEDLQAFQAKHFPGSTQPLTNTLAEQHPIQQEGEEYYYDEEEDDLGYYPDGVKRTLTDEQIRIFRHSEIHALLREKELREEEEAEARAEAEAEAERERTKAKYAAADAKPVTLSTATVTVAPVREAQQTTQTRPDEDTPMDYGDGGSAPSRSYGDASASTSRRAPQFPGRRIISYDD